MAEVIQARELSPQEQQQRAEACFKLDQWVRAGLRKGREALWETAEALYHFYEERAWSALGYESLSEWLADPEVGITSSTYYRMVRSWRELIVYRKVPMATVQALDQSKVDLVLPAIEQGRVKVDEALGDVVALGKRDLREKYVFAPGAPVHPDNEEPEEPSEPTGAPVDLSEPTRASDIGLDGQVAEEAADELPGIDLQQAWTQISEALASNAPYPRIRRDALLLVFMTFGMEEEPESETP